jgi:tetratricopeptide (TPR) repeat protein
VNLRLRLVVGSAFLFFIGLTPAINSAQVKAEIEVKKAKPKCVFKPTITLQNIVSVEVAADPAARRYGVDPALLLALFWNESMWDPDVAGCSRELGIGQFTPDTAKQLGIRNRYDPVESSQKGAKFLAYLLHKYSKAPGNPVDFALAAWNLGEGAVDTCSHKNKYNGIQYEGDQKPCVPPDAWYTADALGNLTNKPTTYINNVKGYLAVTRKLVDYVANSKDPDKADETSRLRVELEKAVNELAEKDQQIGELNQRITNLNDDIRTLHDQLARAPYGAAAQEAEQRVEAARLEYVELESKIGELKKTNPNADSEVASLKERLASADSELESLQKQLVQKDTIIADKTKQIEQQKTDIAALQRQIDEIKNSPDRSAAQVAILRDEIAAQNSKIKDLEDPLLEKELRTQLGSMSNELDLVCESFAECMSRGQRAYHSNDFSAALGFFRQAEIISPESPLSWHWVGHASMAAGRAEEAYTAWDRLLALHGGIPLTACEEVGQPMCEGGTLTISAGSLARYKGDNKVFEVPLSSVRVLNAANRRSGSHITFDLQINGVAHAFDFFPMGFNCPWKGSVTCPVEGQNIQVKIGEYAARTIQRLNAAGTPGSVSSTVAAPGASIPPQSAPETKFYAVQWIKPSGTEKVKIWPGSETSNTVLIERLDGAIIQKAAYTEIAGLDINRRKVRISGPGEVFYIPLPGAGLPKTYQLCFNISGQTQKVPYCFVSESATCNMGQYCREGTDGGVTIQHLAEDIRSHLARH